MLFLTFAHWLEADSAPAVDSTTGAPLGPMFTRWLPDGRNDAVSIPVPDSRCQLRVWFERRGSTEGGFIRFSASKREFDPAVMAHQGRLNAGAMFGEAVFAPPSGSELNALRSDQHNDDYRALAKRVVGFLQPPVARFVDALRLKYGQYWIDSPRPWDSRRCSLGSYCAGWQLRWRETEAGEWRDFLPDQPTIFLSGGSTSASEFGQFLTEADWRDLQDNPPTESAPFEFEVWDEAQRLRHVGHEREALVHAVTALEIAIEHFRKTQFTTSDAIKYATERLGTLALREQFAVLAVSASLADEMKIRAVLDAISLRNEIVHEGKNPQVPRAAFDALSHCIARFAGYLQWKRPDVSKGNSILRD